MTFEVLSKFLKASTLISEPHYCTLHSTGKTLQIVLKMTNFITQWHVQIMNVDRIPVIVLALLLCAVVGMITGPLAGNAHPFFWRVIDLFFGKLGDRMDRAHRPQADLMSRGLFSSVLVIILATFIGQSFETFAAQTPAYGITRIILLSSLFAAGSIWFVLLKLYFTMENNTVGQGAFYAIARTTRINLAAGDDYGVTRAAVSLSARSFDKGLVAPALWYLIGGFPAACTYVALTALSWRFGKNGLGSGFAAVPLVLERLMGMIPSFFAALLITLAAGLTPTARLHKGIAAWFGHKNRAPYAQGGAPVSALSWALNVSVGGAVQDLSGTALKGEWVGPEGATAKLDHKHLRRAIYINVMAHILFVAVLLATYMWGGIL